VLRATAAEANRPAAASSNASAQHKAHRAAVTRRAKRICLCLMLNAPFAA
jgi:hypothetical protein